MSTQSPLMTAAEFEELIQRPAGTVKQWVCRHQMPLPYLKIRGKIMLRRDTVEAWLNSEIPPYQKPPKSTPPASTSSASAPAKRRGRPPRVPDLARQAQQHQTI